MSMQLSPGRERVLLLTLAGVQFTHILDFMIMMPLGPELTRLFGIREAEFGALVSAYTFAAGLSGLLAATYIDRFDRKRLMIALYGLFALATLACGLASSYETLLLARVAAGLSGGVLSALTQTIVAETIPFERRGKAMGVVMTAFSVSTVAGVPASLWVAAHSSWHWPFFLIAGLSAVLALVAYQTLPHLDGHLVHSQGRSVWAEMRAVLAERNHQIAFVFSLLLMMTGFIVIPYITLYMQNNAGMRADQIPWLYLAGGACTFLTGRWMGRLTDRWGKVRVFRIMAVLTLFPLVGITQSAGLPIWILVLISATMFTFMSGRMIPGMALLSAAANPARRGAFMTLNSSVQSIGMGLAAMLGGLVISRNAQGALLHYGVAAVLGAVACLLSMWVIGRLQVHGASPGSANG